MAVAVLEVEINAFTIERAAGNSSIGSVTESILSLGLVDDETIKCVEFCKEYEMFHKYCYLEFSMTIFLKF